jgi:soluble lytic murein transglycosylase-like protein
MRAVTLLTACVILLGTHDAALAGAQIYEPLSDSAKVVMQRSIDDRKIPRLYFNSSIEKVNWLQAMSIRLEKRIPNLTDRLNFLKQLHFAATLSGVDPQMVLAIIQAESGFRKYAVSKAGAHGYMQVMPFWVKELGRPRDRLFDMRTNLHYGCAILRHYLNKENGNYFRALGRYNGSLGKAEYPNLVFATWKKQWQYEGKPG